MDKLNASGLIDDEKFARAFVHDALLKKASGRRLLQRQLAVKGISRDLIKTVLSDLIPEDEEEILLLNAAKMYIKRLRTSLKKTDEEKIRNRTVQYLVRRGFAFNQIIKTIKPLIDYEESWGDD